MTQNQTFILPLTAQQCRLLDHFYQIRRKENKIFLQDIFPDMLDKTNYVRKSSSLFPVIAGIHHRFRCKERIATRHNIPMSCWDGCVVARGVNPTWPSCRVTILLKSENRHDPRSDNLVTDRTVPGARPVRASSGLAAG